MLWAVLSLLLHQNLSFLLTTKCIRTGEVVWGEPQPISPLAPSWVKRPTAKPALSLNLVKWDLTFPPNLPQLLCQGHTEAKGQEVKSRWGLTGC